MTRSSIVALALLLACAFPFPAKVGAAGDPRAPIVELEWPTATGYDRCAAIAIGRRKNGVLAWTAAHCTGNPLALARFFDGWTVSGEAVRVVSRSASSDAALLFIPLDPAHLRSRVLAVPNPKAPPLGAPLTIVGHPVAALRAPAEGRWTITYGRMGETGANDDSGAPEYFVSCTRCGPGDSGGGVFDADGRVIGMIFGVTEIENAANGRLPDGLYADVVPIDTLR